MSDHAEWVINVSNVLLLDHKWDCIVLKYSNM